jgi:hypothetical protein
MRRTKSPSIVISRQPLFAAVVALVAGIAAVTAHAQSMYYGCENKKTGAIRLIATDGPCKPDEVLISWNSGVPASSSDSIQTQLVSQTQFVCACGCPPGSTTPCPLTATTGSNQVEAQCPTGDVVLGGGYNLATPVVPPPITPVPTATPTASPLNPVAPLPAQAFHVIQSAPNETGNAWDVTVATPVPDVTAEVCYIGNCINVTAWAICAPGTATGP